MRSSVALSRREALAEKRRLLAEKREERTQKAPLPATEIDADSRTIERDEPEVLISFI